VNDHETEKQRPGPKGAVEPGETNMHAYIHTYIHTYIRTHAHTQYTFMSFPNSTDSLELFINCDL
jgi:hypothetical protein